MECAVRAERVPQISYYAGATEDGDGRRLRAEAVGRRGVAGGWVADYLDLEIGMRGDGEWDAEEAALDQQGVRCHVVLR